MSDGRSPELGVIRQRMFMGIALLSVLCSPVVAAMIFLAGAPRLALVDGVLGVGLGVSALVLTRLGRPVAARLAILGFGYAIVALVGGAVGPVGHFQHYLLNALGMPFLLLGREHGRLRLGLAVGAAVLALGLALWHWLVPPVVVLEPTLMPLLARFNDAVVFVTAGLMFGMFTSETDRQLSMLRKQSVALARANARLQQANEQLDGFARVVSHDLKTPLAGIMGLVGLFRLEAEGLPPRQAELLDHLESAATNMRGLVDGVLQHARAAGESPVEETDVDAILAEVLAALPVHSLQIHTTPLRAPVTTRSVALRQVLANLISNAVKHHDKPEGRIWVELSRTGGELLVTVRDDGPGIDHAHHDRIFTLYGTAPGRRAVDSTGVGLATVKALVEQVGGAISVDSALGEGACFTVRWPLASLRAEVPTTG